MIVKTIICDRCGAEITEEHPPRINIEEYKDIPHSKCYKTVRKFHFCTACDNAFIRFLQGGNE